MSRAWNHRKQPMAAPGPPVPNRLPLINNDYPGRFFACIIDPETDERIAVVPIYDAAPGEVVEVQINRRPIRDGEGQGSYDNAE